MFMKIRVGRVFIQILLPCLLRIYQGNQGLFLPFPVFAGQNCVPSPLEKAVSSKLKFGSILSWQKPPNLTTLYNIDNSSQHCKYN